MKQTGFANRKKPLTKEQIEECAKLKSIWNLKKSSLGISQKDIAVKANVSDAAISFYLNGRNALNVSIAAIFADTLGIRISEFSPRLEKQFAKLIAKSHSSNKELLELIQNIPPDQSDRAKRILIPIIQDLLGSREDDPLQ